MSATVHQSVRVRLPRRADVPALAAVHVASWRAAYRGVLSDAYLDGLTIKGERRRWYARLRTWPRRDIWVVEADAQPVGFATIGACTQDRRLRGFAGEVFMLYVHPLWQGQGLGRVLMRRALDELAGRGHRWVVVWVLEANEDAQRFYRRFGLRADGARRHDRFRGDHVPVVRYGGAIGQTAASG